jgi:ABC-type uncharacterized transport system permease subunit
MCSDTVPVYKRMKTRLIHPLSKIFTVSNREVHVETITTIISNLLILSPTIVAYAFIQISP